MSAPIVVVIDDEALLRWAIVESLTSAGFAVCQGGSAADALRCVDKAADSPLVVVLDLKLPDSSDLSLARQLMVQRPDAPVIIMTAHGSAQDKAEAEAAGVFKFIQKPFDLTEMTTVVRAATAKLGSW
jgi:DNA-binding NtrC family response regulator